MKNSLMSLFALGLSLIGLVMSACGTASLSETCEPKKTECHPTENKLMTCSEDGLIWLVEECPERTTCQEGECKLSGCDPDTLRCNENSVQWCNLTGTTWVKRMDCAGDQTCTDGTCLDNACTPGDKQCTTDAIFICSSETGAWEHHPCPEGFHCLFGECLECLNDDGCQNGSMCEKGQCMQKAFTIATEAVPDASLDAPYFVTLEAKYGTEPYSWAVILGQLPEGLSLGKETGTISGTAQEGPAQVFTFTVQVTDAKLLKASKEFTLSLLTEGLHVASPSPLPDAEEGLEYQTQLQATGGVPPYAWMISSGQFPDGLLLYADGTITGIPTAINTFTFEVKVFDNQDPPELASKELSLTVKIAPLEIIGEKSYNFILTKLIVLDVFIPNGIFPYETQLQARGGLKPYHWIEPPEIPTSYQLALKLLGVDPNTWKIPPEFTLEDGGKLSGTKDNTDGVTELNIPIINITVKGFFFYGEVSDSQDPAEKKNAFFCIPTIAL